MKSYTKLELIPLGVAMEVCVLAGSKDDVINENSQTTIDEQAGGDAITLDKWDLN